MDGRIMKRKDLSESQSEPEDLVEAVVAKIRPLPATVLPSEHFLKQMRLRLLSLQSQATKRAA